MSELNVFASLVNSDMARKESVSKCFRFPELPILAHLHLTIVKILDLDAIGQLMKERRILTFECEQVPPMDCLSTEWPH